MMRRRRAILAGVLAVAVSCGMASAAAAQSAAVSDRPETPFKLATYAVSGADRVALVLNDRDLVDIAEANAYLQREAGVPAMTLPGEMRALIEQYGTVSKRLYQIANYLSGRPLEGLGFVHRVSEVSIQAPIKYPWNLLSAAANYRSHANEMFTPSRGQATAPAQGAAGRGAPDVNSVDPDKEDPVMFAKSPRSCIIGTGEPFFIPPGRNIDWEAELAIIIGREAFNVSEAEAHDYVFGYSILYDVSDRGGTGMRPLTSMFTGPNWFRGKSRDRGAPFGPFIVPKEFLPNHQNLRIVTKVNGVVKQDGNTRDMIWDEPRLVRFLTSILTLYPGDVIATGTPDGVGTARNPPEYLKPGDVVTIEIEGIGTLETPMRARSSND